MYILKWEIITHVWLELTVRFEVTFKLFEIEKLPQNHIILRNKLL